MVKVLNVFANARIIKGIGTKWKSIGLSHMKVICTFLATTFNVFAKCLYSSLPQINSVINKDSQMGVFFL